MKGEKPGNCKNPLNTPGNPLEFNSFCTMGTLLLKYTMVLSTYSFIFPVNSMLCCYCVLNLEQVWIFMALWVFNFVTTLIMVIIIPLQIW